MVTFPISCNLPLRFLRRLEDASRTRREERYRMTRTRAQRLLLTMIALLCLRFGFLRPRLERRKKSCADEARLEARRLSAEARRHVRDRFRSRVIGDVIGAFVVTYGAGYLVWLLGHPGQTDAQMFEPYQWVPDIRPHLDGLVTPETARNWIGIALAASVSISITLSMRNKGSESYIEQAAMALWRQCMDAMTSALACACVVVMTVGWLGVHDKSDVGAMVLATFGTIAIFLMSSILLDDFSSASRYRRQEVLEQRLDRLHKWRTVLRDKGVPSVSNGQRHSLVGALFVRTAAVSAPLWVGVVLYVSVVRVLRDQAMAGSYLWQTAILVPTVVTFFLFVIGFCALTSWSSFNTKRMKLHFVLQPFAAWILWGSVALPTTMVAAVERGISSGAFVGFLLLGLPLAILSLFRVSRAGKVHLRRRRLYQLAVWFSLPVWVRVHARLDQSELLSRADLQRESANPLYRAVDPCGEGDPASSPSSHTIARAASRSVKKHVHGGWRPGRGVDDKPESVGRDGVFGCEGG